MTPHKRLQVLWYLADGFLGGTMIVFLLFVVWLFLPAIRGGIGMGEGLVYALGILLVVLSLPKLYAIWTQYTSDRFASLPQQDWQGRRHSGWRIAIAIVIGGILIAIELLLRFGVPSYYPGWLGVPLPLVIGSLGWFLCWSIADETEDRV